MTDSAPRIDAWPGGQKLCVMITVMLEAWPDGVAPPYSPMAMPLREGAVDLQGIAWAEYGGRTGVWRLLRLFEAHGVRATVATSGRAVERYPESVKALHAAGHEIAGHSYTQSMFLPYMAPNAERAMIEDCAGIIAAATGERPHGWASPRMTPTEHTAGFLAEAGMLWHGDYHDTDLPYVLATEAGPIVALANSDFADNRLLRGSPNDFWDVYRDTTDFLLASDRPEILNLTVHAHFGGRPPMAAVLDRVLRHLRGKEAIWFARHDEVARWVLSRAASRG